MRFSVLLGLLVSMIAAPFALGAQTSSMFSFREKQGPHAVGLRVVEQYDASRTFLPLTDELGKPAKGERARPLQTLIWYPAKESGAGRRVTVGDYAALKATEVSFGVPKQATGIGAWFEEGKKAAASQAMWAIKNSPPEQGRFPVVIYAPSFSSVSWENADLCEYLASYGYVVIAGPGMGVGHESTHDVAGVDAQARDISFLIGYAQTLADTDMAEVAVAGFSWGGLSNVFAAARDNRIDALVALDGSLRYFPGLVKAGDVHPETMTLPLLYFKGASSLEGQARLDEMFRSQGPSVLNGWTHGDVVSVEMLGMVHPEFSSMAQRNEKFWEYEFARLQQADYGREDGTAGYGWVARYTLEFLDAYLKKDAASVEFLKRKPAENGVPLHMMGVSFRQAESLPYSLQSLQVAAGEQGFDRVAEMYAAMQKKQPGFHVEAGALASWATELLADGRVNEAIPVMKLAVEMDASSGAYTSLGEMYRKAGEKGLARENYQKALDKDAHNILAEQNLAELKGRD